MPRKKGDGRLGRLRTLISRAQARCGARAAELRQAHGWLLEIAGHLDPPPLDAAGPAPTGTQVHERVEACLAKLIAACQADAVPAWLRPKLEHVAVVLRRLGVGLYHCYEVPGLPRTDNDLEQFYRRLKTQERRITGHKRSDSFVVRVGGFAAYAAAASDEPERAVFQRLATVPASAWQQERTRLRANQERQAKMRRFRLHRAAYLADLEARWAQLTEPP